jgi:polynucleotide 5'-hydroxyl-kinase GRC3/NOL9
MSCISQLLDQYRYEVQYAIETSSNSHRISEVVPLVINTQGWVKGLGADLLLQIEHLAEPTHTFAFVDQSDNTADNQTGRGMDDQPTQLFQGEDYGLEPDVQLHGGYGKVFHLQSIPVSPLLSRFTASDMRIISTISYLHARINNNDITWDFSSPLACHQPWQVDLEAVFQELYLTGEGADGIIQDDLPLVLNAKLVALVERVEGTTQEFYQPGRQLPDPSEINCVGFGLIRSISPDCKTIHLLSPIAPVHLSRANIMIGGELELPVCGMLDWRVSCNPASVVQSGLFGVPWADVPYLTVGDQGVGMGRRKWRRNVMRKGQGA